MKESSNIINKIKNKFFLRLNLKNDKGAIAIIAAISLIVLIAMMGFVVDVGALYAEKAKLQNAMDAASLAGAQDLPNTSNATATANQYLQLNGYDPSDFTITFSDSNHVISISGTKNVGFSFMKVLGFQDSDVYSTADARKTAISAAFDYAIFSGNRWPDPPNFPVRLQNKLIMTASSNTVNGNIHGNYDVNTYGNTINGNVEAVGTVEGSNIGNKMPGSPYIPMPDFSSVVPTILAQAQAAGQYYSGDFSKANASSLNLTQPVYVEGDANLTGISFSGVGTIYAGGKISITGSSTDYITGSNICIYSGYTSSYKADAAIDFAGSDKSFKGILYAPNGSILVTGSDYTFTGSVVGTVVDVSGSNKTFQAENTSDSFPYSKSSVALIK